jgi:hypothetical protein
VSGSSPTDSLLRIGPVPAVVYAAMLAATTAGQMLGIGAEAAFGSHGIWLPIACSVALEALVAARMGAARLERPLSAVESARLSAYYSLALAAGSAVLVVWIAASRQAPAGDPDPARGHPLWMWLTAFAVGALVRWGLMVAASPSPPRLPGDGAQAGRP